MSVETALPPGTAIDLGLPAQIVDAEVVRVGSWLLYEGLLKGKVVWIREYCPEGLVKRGDGEVLVPIDPGHATIWEAARTRFALLAEGLLQLRHPGILDVTHISTEGLLLLAGPKPTGTTIAAHLAQEDLFSPHGAITLAAQLADALGHAHGEGVLHLDIRPETVLLSGDRAIITNFTIDERPYMRALKTVAPFVHPPYSPMELHDDAAREPLVPATDIYEASSLLYAVMTDANPPTWQQRGGTNPAPLTLPAPDVPGRTGGSGFSAAFIDAIRQGLTLDPVESFNSTEEWLEAMGSPPGALGAAGWFDSKEEVEESGGSSWLKWLLGILLAGAALAGAYFAWHHYIGRPPANDCATADCGNESEAGSNDGSADNAMTVADGDSSGAANASEAGNTAEAGNTTEAGNVQEPPPVVETPPAVEPLALAETAGLWRAGSGACDHRISIDGNRLSLTIGSMDFEHAVRDERRSGGETSRETSWSSRVTSASTRYYVNAEFDWTFVSEDELWQTPRLGRAREVWHRCRRRG